MLRAAAFLIATPLLLTAMPAWSQTAPSTGGTEPPVAVEENTTTAKVDVVAVDHEQRTATLRGDDGEEFTMNVPDTVRNFDQIQPGDQLTISYNVATAIFLQKAPAGAGSGGSGGTGEGSSSPSAAEPSVTSYETVQVAPRGSKPAGVRARVTQITATVEDVNYDKRQVTLRGPRGNVRTIDVGDNVPDFDQIKKGDTVMVRHTEAVAATVTK